MVLCSLFNLFSIFLFLLLLNAIVQLEKKVLYGTSIDEYFYNSVKGHRKLLRHELHYEQSNEKGNHHHKHHHSRHSHVHNRPITVNHNGTYVNLRYKIGGTSGFLDLPVERRTDKNLKLIVDVGLFTGSDLICLLYFDPDLVYIGLEAHPVNWGVSYNNMLREVIQEFSSLLCIAMSFCNFLLLLQPPTTLGVLF